MNLKEEKYKRKVFFCKLKTIAEGVFRSNHLSTHALKTTDEIKSFFKTIFKTSSEINSTMNQIYNFLIEEDMSDLSKTIKTLFDVISSQLSVFQTNFFQLHDFSIQSMKAFIEPEFSKKESIFSYHKQASFSEIKKKHESKLNENEIEKTKLKPPVSKNNVKYVFKKSNNMPETIFGSNNTAYDEVGAEKERINGVVEKMIYCINNNTPIEVEKLTDPRIIIPLSQRIIKDFESQQLKNNLIIQNLIWKLSKYESQKFNYESIHQNLTDIIVTNQQMASNRMGIETKHIDFGELREFSELDDMDENLKKKIEIKVSKVCSFFIDKINTLQSIKRVPVAIQTDVSAIENDYRISLYEGKIRRLEENLSTKCYLIVDLEHQITTLQQKSALDEDNNFENEKKSPTSEWSEAQIINLRQSLRA